MVNIKKCNQCLKDIYYKPIFSNTYGDKTTKIMEFVKMNIDKTVHVCNEKEESGSYEDCMNAKENQIQVQERAFQNWLAFCGCDW